MSCHYMSNLSRSQSRDRIVLVSGPIVNTCVWMRLLSCHFTTCDNLGGSATVTACAFEIPTLTLEDEEEGEEATAAAAKVCLKCGRNELRRLVVSVEAEEEEEILESQAQRIAGAAAPSTLAMAAINN